MKSQPIRKDWCLYSVSTLIALCFFWGGSGFLVWSSQLGQLMDSDRVLLITECGGYLVQFLGVALCGLAVKHIPRAVFSRYALPAAGGVFLLALILSLVFNTLPVAIIGGIFTNFSCGYVQGLYLIDLTCLVPQHQRGRTFGFSYALGVIGTYIASALCGGHLYSTGVVIIVGVALGLTLIVNYRILPDLDHLITRPLSAPPENADVFRKQLVQMCVLVFLFNLLYKTSFYSSEIIYLSGAIPVEFVRAFSAFGLIIAGIVNDWSRKYGLVTCLLSLLFPFLCLTLVNIPGTAAVLCILCFILLSFIIVFRAISIPDMVDKDVLLLPFAAMGLGIGRLGEAFGTGIGFQLRTHQVTLISFLAVLFVMVVLYSFYLYQQIYAVAPTEEQREEIALSDFENSYDLSRREREIFRLVILGKSNAELADALYVTESTIKFHIGHILKKTNCTNRSDLIKKYFREKKRAHLMGY